MNEIAISQQAGTLSANFEEVKAYLSEQLEMYKGLVFTEESKKSAKDTVATLRKQKKSLQDAVKAAKKEYLKPFDAFEAEAEEVYKLYDEPIEFIAGQIEAFEASRIEAKRIRINEIYIELNEDMQDILPLAKIYNSKWENATYSEKQIREDIMEKRISAKTAIDAIRCMASEAEDKAIQLYLDTFDLSAVMHFIRDYEDQKKEILSRESERVAADVEKDIINQFVPDDIGTVENHIYSISLSADGKQKLEMFMDSVGIQYEEIVL